MDTKYFTQAMEFWNKKNDLFLMYSEMSNVQRSEMWAIAQELKDKNSIDKSKCEFGFDCPNCHGDHVF